MRSHPQPQGHVSTVAKTKEAFGSNALEEPFNFQGRMLGE